jgi:hypothetical protein
MTTGNLIKYSSFPNVKQKYRIPPRFQASTGQQFSANSCVFVMNRDRSNKAMLTDYCVVVDSKNTEKI